MIDYGPVMFIRGKYQGRVGYYDDDKGNEAIVYLGEPFKSEYVVVPPTHLGSFGRSKNVPTFKQGASLTKKSECVVRRSV